MANPMMGILDMFIKQQTSNGQELTPFQKSCIDMIKSGDSKKGEEFANNLLKEHGAKKEDAVGQASQFFSSMGFFK